MCLVGKHEIYCHVSWYIYSKRPNPAIQIWWMVDGGWWWRWQWSPYFVNTFNFTLIFTIICYFNDKCMTWTIEWNILNFGKSKMHRFFICDASFYFTTILVTKFEYEYDCLSLSLSTFNIQHSKFICTLCTLVHREFSENQRCEMIRFASKFTVDIRQSVFFFTSFFFSFIVYTKWFDMCGVGSGDD